MANPVTVFITVEGACAGCVHWKENEPQSAEDAALGMSVHELDALGWGKCELTETSNGNSLAQQESGAVAMDSEAYHAVLLTRPFFGCNQHTPKEGQSVKENH